MKTNGTEQKDFFKVLAGELKQRNNPIDLKSGIIARVEQVSPKVIVSYSEGKIFLVEDEELLISEWFRFRCNIDKTSRLTKDVPQDREDCQTERDNSASNIALSDSSRAQAEGVIESAVIPSSLVPCVSVANPVTFALSQAIKHNSNSNDNLSLAINYLSDAIFHINNELYALKCHLKIGDYVLIASLEQKDRFVLVDKILDPAYVFYDEQ